MIEWIPFAVALGGCSLAAAYDLKTTEIPDQIPYTMAAIGLIYYAIFSFAASNYSLIGFSLLYGIILTAIGFALYYFGQWGGGDAKLLGAIAVLLPSIPTSTNFIFPFPFSFTINLFLVGAVYMIFYSIVFSLMNKHIISKFLIDIKASANVLVIGSVSLLIIFTALNLYLLNLFQFSPDIAQAVRSSLIPLAVSVSLFVLYKFAKIVENVGFKKRISVNKVRIGDVLLDFKQWEGITGKQLKKLKKSGKKFVWIKEGVRFAPSFPLALLFSLFFGEGIMLILNTVI